MTKLKTPRIQDVDHVVGYQDVLELGPAFAADGLTGRFGATYIHGHFPVGDDEALLVTDAADGRSQSTSVVSLVEAAAHHPVAWRFTDAGEPVTTLWSVSGGNADLEELIKLQHSLQRAGEILAARGLTESLAVVWRATRLQVQPGEALLETTDETARTQITEVVSLAEAQQAGVPATFWFRPDGEPMAGGWCSAVGQGRFH